MLLALSIAAAGLLLYHVHPLVHALGKNEATLEIGAGEAKVKASLSEKGVLTISGTGRTRDYTADTAPFEEYADRIVSVKIEEGVTGIGDYLFYNCGNLKGSLTLPSTLIWIGAESFSGDSQETSPKFTSVISRFREAEIARLKPGAEIPETRETESGTEILATPGEAESKPEETSENGTGETLPTEGAESQSTEAGDHAGERPTTAGPDGTEPTTVEPSGTEPTTAGASGMEPTTAGAGSGSTTAGSSGQGTTTAGTSGSGSTTSGASGPESTTAGASGPEPTTAGPSGTEPTTAGPTGTEPTTAEPSAEPLAAAPDNQNSQTAEKAGTFIMASSRLSGPFRGFTLNDSETVVSESEAESEETSESETHDTGEAPQPSPEAPTETKAGSKPTASPSTPQSTESDEEDIEPTEEFSEDGLLSNNLYDGVIAAAEVKNSEREYYTFETITSQLIGDAVFYSGQKGAYDCEPENTSFADAAEQAGYRKADRFIQVEMEGTRASLPVVDGAFYAPEVPEGLNGPEDDDPVFISCFTGWTLERDWESMGESAPVYETGTAVPVSEDEELVSLYGNWEKTCSFVPEVRAEARDNLTVYSVVDANTEQPIPESGSYLIQYQWQICRPEPEAEPETADNESVTLNNDQTGPGMTAEAEENLTGPGMTTGAQKNQTGPGMTGEAQENQTGPGMTTEAEENLTSPDMIAEEEPDIIGLGIPAENENLADETIPLTAHPENEESWEDIGEAVSAVYERQAETTDAKSYFRVVLSVEKVTYFRSASQPVIMVSDPVSGKAEAVKITVTLEAGGADGTAPAVEPVKDGLWLAPQANPFTRTDGQVFTGWQVSAAGAEALLKDGSSAVGNVILESDDLILSAASSAANPSVTLTAQWSADVCVIYVDSNGKDTNSGLSASEAVKTLSKAYEKLTKTSMAQNRIVLCGTYSTGAITLGGKPAVITGLNPENGSKGTFTLNGALSCGADTTFENMTINTAQSQKIFANCHKLIMGYGLTMSNGKPNIYGGGASDLTGDADIILCSGAYNTIAGSGSVHSITGNSNITVINAEMSSLYGGGSYESSPNPSNTVWVDGNAYIHFYGGTCTDSIFGGPRFGVLGGAVYMEIYGGDISTIVGGSHSGFAASVAGKINIAIHGGTIQTVYGGAYDGNKSNIDRSPCQDDVNILTDGGVIAGDLFCGSSGFYNVPQYISIRGNVEAEFTGGKIKGNLYGGSDLDKIQGNVTIRLAGVEVAGNVYGGGVGRKDYNGTLFYAYIGGNVTVDIESGTVIGGNVYGGSKDHGTIDGDVTINYNGSSLQEAGSSLYGGGYGTETTIKGSSRITVNSGAFIADSLYGCGEQGKVLGGSTVILNGGTIGNNVFAAGNDVGATATTLIVNGTTAVGNGIYGGSNHSETTNTAEITINSPIDTVIYGGGFGENTTVTNAAITIASGGDVKKSVFGGGNLGKVTNSEITVNGTVKDVYGGGNSAGVTGTIKVTVSEGAEAGNVYGGCNEVGTTANPQLTIAGKVTGSVYGGGQGINTSTAAPVVGLSGKGTIAGSLFGGGNAGIVTRGTTLNITGGHANLIFGGGDAREVTGGTAVSMTGGTAGSIYGGGNSAGVDGTVTINLGSGAEAANVYGGSNSQGTVVSPRITIEGKAGNVYASGQGSGTITKSPTVTLEKTASVTNLYGGGMEGDTQDGTTLILKNEDTPVQNVYGGGNKAGVTGTAAITQEANARAARIFGGSNSSGTVTVSTLTVNGQVGAEAAGTDAAGTEADGTTEEAQPTGVLYGAGYGDGTITGATNVTVGATAIVHGDVFGGGEKGLVSGDTSVLLNSSAQLTGGLYGGGNEAIVKGSTHVQADKDSVVAGSVYGGGKGEEAVVNTNTRVIVSAHVTGNAFGGGAKGPVVGSTHVDIPQGLIDGEGNVFGGSDQALVSENTQVHIGTEAADGNHIDITDDTSLLIHGTVFGGGNTTADGSNFDARHPFVEGSSEVSVTATGYGRDKFNIMTSIFGDGNKCVVAGSRTVILTDYHALGDLANASIQRADTLTLDQCEVELIGAVDSANLVPTIAYSLNRIDDLRLVGGSVLKLQSSVNLVRSLKSLDKSPEDGGTPVKTTSTTDLGVQPSTENKIYIQQGNQMELRTSEDITTTQYGKVSGYSLLFSYDINGAPIQSGVYVLGGYGETAAGGFLYGEAGADQYKMIDPRTDNQNWKNWALGTDMTKNGILVMSNKPAGRKIVQIESPWGGGRMDQFTVRSRSRTNLRWRLCPRAEAPIPFRTRLP